MRESELKDTLLLSPQDLSRLEKEGVLRVKSNAYEISIVVNLVR